MECVVNTVEAKKSVYKLQAGDILKFINSDSVILIINVSGTQELRGVWLKFMGDKCPSLGWDSIVESLQKDFDRGCCHLVPSVTLTT